MKGGEDMAVGEDGVEGVDGTDGVTDYGDVGDREGGEEARENVYFGGARRSAPISSPVSGRTMITQRTFESGHHLKDW